MNEESLDDEAGKCGHEKCDGERVRVGEGTQRGGTAPCIGETSRAA